MSLRMTGEKREGIEALLFDWLAETGAPGASLVIVDEFEEMVGTGVGARDRKENDPATPDTLYGYASVTKSFTAMAILQQVAAGTIGLEDSIAEHTDANFDGIEDVTIGDLLTHTSGLPSVATSTILISRFAEIGETGIPISTRDDLIHFLREAGAERDGLSHGRFLYNNTGYYLLEFAVETVTGRSFTEYVESEILEPLGMARSTFDPVEAAADDDSATPYRTRDDGFEPATFPSGDIAFGAGGLISSPREMGHYLQYQLTGETNAGEKLLERELLAEAHEPHVDSLPHYGDGYGYGWTRRELAGTVIVGHGGSLLTSSSAVGFLPKEGVGVALGCAGQPAIHPTSILEGVVAIVLGEDPHGHQPALAYRDRVTDLTGEYRGYRNVVCATVVDGGGHLCVDLTMGGIDEELILVPEDPSLCSTTFTASARGRRYPVEFVETENGYDLFLDRYRLHKAN